MDKPKAKREKESLGIRRIKTCLKALDIPFKLEVSFAECRDDRELPFDILVIVNGRAGLIEYDGGQHFNVTPIFHGEGPEAQLKFKKQQLHDTKKNIFTRTYNISLLRISTREDSTLEEWVRKFIVALRTATQRIDMFSNTIQYKAAYNMDVPVYIDNLTTQFTLLNITETNTANTTSDGCIIS